MLSYAADDEREPDSVSRVRSFRYSFAPELNVHEMISKIMEAKNNHNLQKRETSLKRLLRKNKVQRLVGNFVDKLRRNSVYRKPVALAGAVKRFEKYKALQWLVNTQGIQLNKLQNSVLTICSLILIIALTIMYSLALVFPEMDNSPTLRLLQTVGLVFYSIEMLLGFVTQNYENGTARVNLWDIGVVYLRYKFLIDFTSLLVLALDTSLDNRSHEFNLLRLAILFKLSQVLDKLDTIESLFVNNFSRQQYFGLFMVLMTNLCIAHLLAVLLIYMGSLGEQDSWIIKNGLESREWYQRYVWGLYWGTNIMFTVGFGDFVATTETEAIFIVAIEMVSCIMLAYNINCVGNLITNLRAQYLERNRNLKIFNNMSKNSGLSEEVDRRINNYIQESYVIRKEFNFNEQDSLLKFLPNSLKQEYLKDANNRIFKEAPFLKTLTLKTRAILAENIKRRISHPEELVLRCGEPMKLLIIDRGKTGLCLKKTGCKNNGQVVQTLEATSNISKLISLDFVKNRRITYDIKSLTYCVLFYFQNDSFIEYLKQSKIDYEHYCLIRDKTEFEVEDYELYVCTHCKTRHNSFACARLHYIPIRDQVVAKYLRDIKQGSQKRLGVYRRQRFHNVLQYTQESSLLIQYREDYFVEANSTLTQKQFLHFVENNETFRRRDLRHQTFNFKEYPERLIYEQLVTLLTKKEAVVWDVQSDQMCNWKYYFPNSNPEKLGGRLRNMKH